MLKIKKNFFLFFFLFLIILNSSYAVTWNEIGGNSYLNGTGDHALLTNLPWSVAGHTMDSDLVIIGSNKIILGENATYLDFDGANLHIQSSAPIKIREDFDMKGNNIYGVSNLTTEGDIIVGDHLVFGNETNNTAFDNPTIYRNGALGLVFYADDGSSNITFTAGNNGGNFLNYMESFFTDFVNFTSNVNFVDDVNFWDSVVFLSDVNMIDLYIDNIYGYTDDGFTMFTGTADNQINISETSGYGYGASPYLEGVWDVGGFLELPLLSTGGMVSKPKIADGSFDYIGWLITNGEADDSDIGGTTWTNRDGVVIYSQSDDVDANITVVPQGKFIVGNGTQIVNSEFDGDLTVTGNITGNLIYAQMGEKFGYATPLVVSYAEDGVYYNMTNMTFTNLNGFKYFNDTQALGGSHLMALHSGKYKIDASFSGEGSTAGGVYGIVAVKNFNKVTYEENCYIQVEGTTNVDSHSFSCIMDLDQYDNVSIQSEDEADPTKAIQISSHNFAIWRIGN